MEDHRHDQESTTGLIEADEGEGLEVRETHIPEAVLATAAADMERSDGELPTQEQMVSAMDWLLTDEPPGESARTKTLTVTIRPGSKMRWTIRALEGQEFRMLRRAALGNRQQRRALIQDQDPSGIDESKYHALVLTQATVEPNLAEAAKAKNIDALSIVQHRFRFLPGVLAEMAGYVNELSGYDPDLVEEEVAGAAAGNS
jgi:hypothetical protein